MAYKADIYGGKGSKSNGKVKKLNSSKTAAKKVTGKMKKGAGAMFTKV